jgi:two-component system, chemotaxis family, protein-glutamate methylesterase/glutaminase
MGGYDCVVIGASAGGLRAVCDVLRELPATYPMPILFVQHLLPEQPSSLAAVLGARLSLRAFEAADKRRLTAGDVCVGVPDYHLHVERLQRSETREYCAGLSQESPVLYSRPAVDVLFESAAVSTSGRVIGVVLTGANEDGALGAACIKRWGGRLLVQEPQTAEAPQMPRAALAAAEPDLVGDLKQIANHLVRLGESNESSAVHGPIEH